MTSETGHLYHLVQKPLWESCKTQQQPYFPPTYEQDGFIHLTKAAAVLLDIGNYFYKGVADDFLLLCLDPAKLTAKVVFEAAAAVGSTPAGDVGKQPEQTAAPLFPHLYGTIDYAAVASELHVERAADGTFLSIRGL